MNRIGVILLVSVILVSCNKWKKPTDVHFYADINKTATLNGQLTFTGGSFVIERFEFDGDREKGDDVFFEKDFTSGLSIPFNENLAIPDLQFMIPQGEYKRLDVRLRTFDDNGTVSISVEGQYTYDAGGSVPFRFDFDKSEQFDIRAENDNGGNIVLDKDVLSPAKILLDPEFWFSPVPKSLFESALLTDVEGTNTIVISKDNNSDIYDILLDRLDDTALIVFNY